MLDSPVSFPIGRPYRRRAATSVAAMWVQRQLQLAPRPRGFHLITRDVLTGLPELAQIRIGLLHVFILHTSASLTINESASPDVRVDLETVMGRIAPEDD